MSDQGTSVACCAYCGMPIASPLPTVPEVPGPPEPQGAPIPPAEVPVPNPPGAAIATWPVRIPLADGSYVWLPVPWPANDPATTTGIPTTAISSNPAPTQPAAGPTTEPIGHDASRPPATA